MGLFGDDCVKALVKALVNNAVGALRLMALGETCGGGGFEDGFFGSPLEGGVGGELQCETSNIT